MFGWMQRHVGLHHPAGEHFLQYQVQVVRQLQRSQSSTPLPWQPMPQLSINATPTIPLKKGKQTLTSSFSHLIESCHAFIKVEKSFGSFGILNIVNINGLTSLTFFRRKVILI